MTTLTRQMLLLLIGVGILLTAADGIGTPPAATGELRPATLQIALLPDEDPAKIVQENQAFVAYLEQRLGVTVKLTVPHSYAVLVESMRAGRLHLAYFGPAAYVLCKDKGTEITPFAAKLKHGSTTYHSVIIGNKTKGIDGLAKIKGGKMGFGDPASTSSHLIPKGELLQVDLQPRRDYEQVFLGAHDAVALNVQSGSVLAGGLSQSIYTKLLAKGSISDDQVQLLHTSPAFPQYPWAWRNDLAPDFKKEIQQAFLKLDDPAILSALHAEGFAAIDDAAYDVVRKLQKTVDAFR